MTGVVVSVASSPAHRFSKEPSERIELIAGIGVKGDSHAGEKVQHRSRVRANPDQPNLRQVHLMAEELFEELSLKGFRVLPGDLGENVTTRGIDLLSLPAGTRLRLGTHASVEITGLRNPCTQIDAFQKGLMGAVLERTPDGGLVRKAGVMAVVLESGPVGAGDAIEITMPEGPHRRLEPV